LVAAPAGTSGKAVHHSSNQFSTRRDVTRANARVGGCQRQVGGQRVRADRQIILTDGCASPRKVTTDFSTAVIRRRRQRQDFQCGQ
jgi:hypothetical protein